MIHSVRMFASLVCGALCLLVALSAGAEEETVQELDAAKIEQALERARALPHLHSLLVAHHGEPVIEYAADGHALNEPTNIKSLSKTILSALVGIAIERGVIDGVDQPIVELLGDLVPADAHPRVGEITVGNLLSMQAGLEPTSGPHYGGWVASDDWVANALSRPFVDEPGGDMLYSTGNTHLLSAALTRATGSDTHTLAQTWLGDPLDIAIPPWTQGPEGIYLGGNEMGLSPRAVMEFGELYRLGGVDDGQRILPASWIEASWTPRTRSVFNNDQYGYGWFINQLAGEEVYYGWGYGGQMLYVIPDLALTVVITSDPTPPSPGRRYLRQLDALVAELLIPAAR